MYCYRVGGKARVERVLEGHVAVVLCSCARVVAHVDVGGARPGEHEAKAVHVDGDVPAAFTAVHHDGAVQARWSRNHIHR